MANNAFLLRPKTKDRGARLFVDFVRGELDPGAVEPFKGEAKHQKFRFGIGKGSLPRCRKPGAANIQFSIVPVDLPEASRADDLFGFDGFGNERNGGAIRPSLQRETDVPHPRFPRRGRP